MFKGRTRFVIFLCLSLFGLLGLGCAKNPHSLDSDADSAAGIIGGQPVPAKNPVSYQVMYLALGVKTGPNGELTWTSHCTATALSSRVILTAGHCVVGKKIEEIRLVTTFNPEVSPINPKEWLPIKALKVHEEYKVQLEVTEHDLALLYIETDLPMYRILRLAYGQQLYQRHPFAVVGYGTTSALKKTNDSSKEKATLNYVTKNLEKFRYEDDIFTVDQSDHRGFCSGDSGGPALIYNASSRAHFILGIVSSSSLSPDERTQRDPGNKYSLCIGKGNYTNVISNEHLNWIANTAKELSKKK